jgi:hypothetical protein
MEVEGAIVKGVALLSPQPGISETVLLPGRFFFSNTAIPIKEWLSGISG